MAILDCPCPKPDNNDLIQSVQFHGCQEGGPEPCTSHSIIAGSQGKISFTRFQRKGILHNRVLFSPTKCDVSVSWGEKYPKNTNSTSTSVPCSLPFTVHAEKSPRNICCCERPARWLTAPETMPTPITGACEHGKLHSSGKLQLGPSAMYIAPFPE